MADLVKLTRKGIRIIDKKPKIRIERMATKYPRRLVLYSTIEYETASQKGHFTFYDLKYRVFILLMMPTVAQRG